MTLKKTIVLIGATGGIGGELLRQLAEDSYNDVYAFSRSQLSFNAPNIAWHHIDIEDENSIKEAASSLPDGIILSHIIVATGILHNSIIMPEKGLREISLEKFQTLFAINTIGPALVAKYFIPKLTKNTPGVFAAISARVGSISDNQLGGWYAYRASKAALNMIIRTISIEVARKNKQAVIVGLHPGTVDTELSQPFQANVADRKLFTAERSAMHLLDVMDGLTYQDSGKCFAWDGQEILP